MINRPFALLISFLDDDFFNILATQTNMYAAQYIQVNLKLPHHLHFKKWKNFPIEEMIIFIFSYLLTGIIIKPVLK